MKSDKKKRLAREGSPPGNHRRRKESIMLKQKVYGILLAGLSILVAAFTGDATACVFMVPAGVYLLFTKENWLA